MPSPRVSIRLGTDGKAQVVKDFADVGDAGDAQSRRIAMAFARDSAMAEASLEKLNKTATRLAAVSPVAGGPSNLINPITGGSYAQADGAAQASARAIVSAQDQAEGSAKRLLASIDPLYAAQIRYDTALAEATALQAQGALTAEQLATVQVGLKKQLAEATAGQVSSGAAAQSTRFAMMDLNRVVTRSADAYAAGFSPLRIMTTEMGRLDRAALNLSGAGVGGSLEGLLKFLSGPWGIALILGAAVFAPMIAKMFEAGDGADALVAKLKKEAQQAAANDEAHKAFSMTLDGVTAALIKNRAALDNVMDGEKSAAERALKDAIAQKMRLDLINRNTQALIKQAIAQIELNNAQAIGPETKTGRADPNLAAADAARARLAALEATLPDLTKDSVEAQRQIDAATAAVNADIAGKSEVELIRARYKTLVEQATRHAAQEAAAARSAGDQAKAQLAITVELQKQVVALNQKRDAEIKAAEERNKKPGKNAGGEQIFDAQIASFFDIANKYRGNSETRDKGALEAFFRAANENLDPEKTAWCAAFVNAVLAAGGVHGSGSLAAKSFLTYGKDDTHSPQKGDIVVLRTGANQEHVGFLDSINNKTGAVSVLAGNTSNKVGEATYSKGHVLAIRRPPTPSEQASLDDKEATKAQSELTSYNDALARLHDQTLAALEKMKAGYQVTALYQIQAAQNAHDDEAKKIATSLAEGKYGEATSDLAKTRARQLLAANDDLLVQQKATISFNAYLKSLDDNKANFDQQKQFQIQDLKFADEFARSTQEKRKLELQMLDIQYEQKDFDLRTLKAKQDLAGEVEAAARTQAEINRLPTDKAQEQKRVEHSTMSPWQQYMNSLPQNAGELNDLFQQAGVDALTKFDDGLTDVLLKSNSLAEAWRNLGSLFHDVAASILADLIKIAEKEAIMAIFKAVMGAAGGGGGGADWSFGASGGYDAANAGLVGGLATGTESAAGGLTWVGEFGKELVRLPRGSRVTPAAESRRIEAANDRGIGSITIPINIDATGADPASLARTNDELRQLRSDLPALVAQHWSDANTRLLFRGQRQ